MQLQINKQEKDLIREIINIGLAKAADSFAVISHDQVFIDIPEVAILEGNNVIEALHLEKEIISIVESDIEGDLNGQTLLFFTKEEVGILEEACLNFKYSSGETDNMRESLLLEISNILTGALVTNLADMLKLNIYGSVPKMLSYSPEELLADLTAQAGVTKPLLIIFKTTFRKKNTLAELPLLIIFDAGNLLKILEIIRKNDYARFLLSKK